MGQTDMYMTNTLAERFSAKCLRRSLGSAVTDTYCAKTVSERPYAASNSLPLLTNPPPNTFVRIKHSGLVTVISFLQDHFSKSGCVLSGRIVELDLFGYISGYILVRTLDD